jgi:hypothetical protein
MACTGITLPYVHMRLDETQKEINSVINLIEISDITQCSRSSWTVKDKVILVRGHGGLLPHFLDSRLLSLCSTN